MQCHEISSLQVIDLEKRTKLKNDIHNNGNMIEIFNAVQKDDWISSFNMPDFCKLILQEKLWAKLKYNRKMFVHFGWDFYMYIGSISYCPYVIKEIEKSGLFVEEFKFPCI